MLQHAFCQRAPAYISKTNHQDFHAAKIGMQDDGWVAFRY